VVTEVEPLLVRVTGNCCFGSRLRVDNRLLVPPGMTFGCLLGSLVRLHCSRTLFSSCRAGDDKGCSQSLRACYVITIAQAPFVFQPFALPFHQNPLVHGQSLIGLLGCGASKGDGPCLNPSAPSFVPSRPNISWPESDKWLSLRRPIPVFTWAYHEPITSLSTLIDVLLPPELSLVDCIGVWFFS
jgi:hypothetical protein